MQQRDPTSLRLTHKPTGISVTVYCDRMATPRTRNPNHPAVMARARSLLAAKLWAAQNPQPEIRRSYHLSPDYCVGIRQDGKVLASGPGIFETIHYGIGLDRVMLEARRP